MSANKVEVNLGGGLLGVLGIVLIILKVAGIAPVADWSWWLVTLPFWFGFAFILAFGAIMVVCAAVGAAILFGVGWVWEGLKYRRPRTRLRKTPYRRW